jgi:hypothetical protein
MPWKDQSLALLLFSSVSLYYAGLPGKHQFLHGSIFLPEKQTILEIFI